MSKLEIGDIVTVNTTEVGEFWDGAFVIEGINKSAEWSQFVKRIDMCINKFDERDKRWYGLSLKDHYWAVKRIELPMIVAPVSIGVTR